VALTLEAAGYTYGLGRPYAVRALRGVSLALEPGTLTLLVGATGSGKSTLMRVMAGLLKPDEGRALLDGTVMEPGTARGAVGLVFQDPESQLFADSVLDDVAFGPRNLGATHADAAQRAAESLRAVGLDPGRYGDRSPFSLSGGEARRAAIAGVLAMGPRYLLADEPTAGLDAAGRELVRSLLLAQRDRSGVLVVSHAAEEFLADADAVVVLVDGQVAWSGSGDAARHGPRVFEDAGLRTPDVLAVQRLAAERHGFSGGFALDPAQAAVALAAAAGWPR
jgi:energy-coupling factor transport system ATP-binding protein